MRNLSFSTDSKHLLVCSGSVVKVFSCSTGSLLRLLVGHSEDVTSARHSPSSLLQAFSSSLDGLIIQWNVDEAIPLRIFCVGKPILSLSLSPLDPQRGFVIVGNSSPPHTPPYCSHLAQGDTVYRISLQLSKRHTARAFGLLAKAKGEGGGEGGGDGEGEGIGEEEGKQGEGSEVAFGGADQPWPAELTPLFKSFEPTRLDVSCCGGEGVVVAVLSGKGEAGQRLYVHCTNSGRTLFLPSPGSSQLGCLALSPTELSLATGDDIGRIHLTSLESLRASPAPKRKAGMLPAAKLDPSAGIGGAGTWGRGGEELCGG
ncbi:MAG: hypothetical protein SGPRY_002479 [Prymnesium sp.]